MGTPRLVFSPGLGSPLLLTARRKVSGLYRALARMEPVLFLAQDQMDLELGAPPGPSTLFTPRFPALAEIALASASFVVTLDAHTLIVAASRGVAGVLIDASGNAADEVAAFGLPYLRLDDLRNNDDLFHQLESVRSCFPWSTVTPKLARAKATCRGWLRLKNGATGKTRRSLPRELRICAVADWSFLPSLLGLRANLRAVGAEHHLHLLTLDDKVRPFLERAKLADRLSFYRLEDIVQKEVHRELMRRPVGPRAYCSKIHLLLHLLEQSPRPVLYSDLDLCFFRSPAHLLNDLRGAVIFPNWSDEPAHRALCGLFNGGLLAAGPGAKPFLRWLAELTLYKCKTEPGFFDDQGYLDLAALHFDEVKVYRGRDENAAPWNLRTLEVHLPEDGNLAQARAGGIALGSFHAQSPDALGLYEAKASWDQVATLFSPLSPREYPGSFYPAVLHQQKYHWPAVRNFLFAGATMKARLHLPRLPTTPSVTRFFVEGPGRPALAALAEPYRACRKTKRWIERTGRAFFRREDAVAGWVRAYRRASDAIAAPPEVE